MDNAKVITFFSPKGGVGKTLIALNAAVGLSLKKKKTLFLDLDLRAPQGTSQLMGLKSKYSLYDISAGLKKFKTEGKSIDSYLTQHRSGLHFLPAILHAREKLAIKPEVIRDFFPLLVNRYEYIIIDAGSSLTDHLITTFDLSNLILLVLTPEITSLYQIEWAIDTMQSLGFPVKMIKIILNRAESKGGVSFQEIKLLLIPEIIALIPSEGRTIGFSVNKGVPVVMDAPGSKVSIAIGKLYEDLISKGKLYIARKELSEVRVERKEEVEESFMERTGEQEVSHKQLEEEDSMIKLKKKIHSRLLEKMDLKTLPVEDMLANAKATKELRAKAEKIVTNIIAEAAGGFISSSEVRRKIIKEVVDEALGLGPLEDLLGDPTVTEIMVNNKNQIYIERDGKIELTTKKFTSNNQVRIVIERILSPLGRRIDESSPYVDARLSDGSRVNAIIPPLSLSGPTLTIRKFSKQRFTMDDLIKRFGSISPEMALFLKAAVISKKNILVSGGTGSGKTTFLNILSSYIPQGERIVTIEDSAELRLDQAHWVRLESRPPNIEGKGAIKVGNLFRNTLRMRPDRIVVGECRGEEVLDMLQAMNTGHDGSMTTIHANSPQDVLIRLDSMILMSGVELPLRAIREMIASAIDLIVQVSRMPDGSRKIIQITEITGMLDETHIDLRDVFTFKQTGIDAQRKVLGCFTPLGYIPSFYDEIKAQGLELPREIFIPKKQPSQ